jgi:hypothetical protein
MASRASVRNSERGVALVMTLMVMALMAALMIGFGAVVASDQRYRYIDRDRVRAFYAASAGLEKLSADLSALFFANVAPTTAQLDSLSEEPPEIPDVQFTSTNDDIKAYGVTYVPPQPGESEWGNIATGPYQGLLANKKEYVLDSSVRTTVGGEAHVKRRVETVAIPVFQFGMFSSVDLSFSAADDFDFGGRVHTNGNLFLAQGGDSSSTLTLRDRVTAVGEIVRQRLSNGASIDTSGSTRTVRVATAPGNSFRVFARTEGSVVDGIPSSANTAWPTISLSTYNGYLRTAKTGVKPLNLPLLNSGGSNIDVIRRAPAGEDSTNPTLLAERYFSKVSLRILLSDTALDITSLPGVTSTPPVELANNWQVAPPNNGVAYGPVDATHSPIALSAGSWTMNAIGNSATNNGSTVTAGADKTIRINAIPAYYQLPQLTVTSGANVYAATCTGKTLTTFTGCTLNPAPVTVPLGATISATVDGVPTQTVTTAAWAYVANSDVNVVNTMAFTPNSFFVNDGATLVTCSGYTTAGNHRFVGCNVPTAIVTNPATPLTSSFRSNAGVSLIGGFIKIERQDAQHVWHDVTMEILNHGIAKSNGPGTGRACGEPSPNAIIRLQRLRDNSETAAMQVGGGTCSYAQSQRPTDFWPNTMYDVREGLYRDVDPGDVNIRPGGLIHYVSLDVANVSAWFAGTGAFAAGTGQQSLTNNGGYSIYFSDRRNNRTLSNLETGEYGFEDVVNPASATGAPNGTLQAGEDMNGNGVLENYGQFPSYNGVSGAVPPCTGTCINTSLNAASRPWIGIPAGVAKVNRALFFRRALKLMNGGLGTIVAPGLTIASENPVYIQGDFNADQANGFGEPNRATSVVADAVTLLSNAWADLNSFITPHSNDARPRSANTFYRVAIIAGKGPIFPRPGNGEGATFGTDGGVHSFLRFLEGGAANTVSYRGSLATFFYNRQAVSPFKCCGGIVYDVPVRNFAFDIDFLDPALLPPLTPVFRDINALGFTQEVRPGF